jgi:hypothetical protein
MNAMIKLAGVVLLGLMTNGAAVPCAGLIAQQGAVVSGQQPSPEIPMAAASTVLLKEGTEVKLALAQRVTGKAAVVGEPIELVLAEDLRVGDAVVARKGTRVLGTIIEGRKSEKENRQPRSLRIRVDFIKARDARIMLRGEKAGVGKRNKKAMAAGAAAFGLSGLLLTMGKKYQIPVGTPVTAYVDEDITLTPLE